MGGFVAGGMQIAAGVGANDPVEVDTDALHFSARFVYSHVLEQPTDVRQFAEQRDRRQLALLSARFAGAGF
jgi:hypothetical protein